MVENKMAAAKLGFEIYALPTIPERADVGDGSGGERGTSETPPKPLRRREGHRAAINGLEGYYRERVKGKSETACEGKSVREVRTYPLPFQE